MHITTDEKCDGYAAFVYRGRPPIIIDKKQLHAQSNVECWVGNVPIRFYGDCVVVDWKHTPPWFDKDAEFYIREAERMVIDIVDGHPEKVVKKILKVVKKILKEEKE